MSRSRLVRTSGGVADRLRSRSGASRTVAAPAPCPGGSRRRAALVLLGALLACTGDQEIEQPAPLSDVSIEYPIQLWEQDVEGRTLIRVRVNERGAVDSALVLESSGHPAFDSAAIEGARALRFRPARKDGEQITVWARVPVHFSKEPRPDSIPPR